MPETREERVFHGVLFDHVSYPENDHLYPDISLQLRDKYFPDALRNPKTGEIVLERKWTYAELRKMPFNTMQEMFGNTELSLLARDRSLQSIRNWAIGMMPYLRRAQRERELASSSA